jgi:hypothetical protein
MTGWSRYAVVVPDGSALRLSNSDWRLTISRVDGARHDAFYAYQGKELCPNEVARFIPNWRALDWRAPPRNMHGSNESCASDGDFQIVVSALRSGQITRQAVVDAFLAYMRGP